MYSKLPILIVDDVSAMREIIIRQLRSRKFENLRVASNAGEAFRIMESEPIRLVLSDWHMPGVSGLELLQKIRAHPRLRHISFILMTGDLPRGALETAVQAGIDDFMLKPFTPAVLEDKIHAALKDGHAKEKAPVAVENGSADPDSLSVDGATPADKMPTVLVVDDVPANLTLASSLLRHDYHVKLAISGEKALALCAIDPPDLILLDVMMPDTDGYSVCKRLKEDGNTAHIPIIFLTALNDVKSVLAGLELGAVDYITKPIEPLILKARVASALRVAQTHEAMRLQLDLMVENIRLREEIENINRHDIKNPLGAITAMARNMLSDTPQNADGQRMLRFMEGAATDALALLQMSSSILQMEQRRYVLKPESVDLQALIQRVADEARVAFAAKHLEIKLSPPATAAQAEPVSPTVEGEPVLLYSMLHNLVKNAAEAVQAGQTIRLELQQDPAGLHLSIHNPGTVPQEFQARFFDKYASHGKSRGTGLGTYSAKLIADTHGAEIYLHSTEERGTTVQVTFPASDADNMPAAANVSADADDSPADEPAPHTPPSDFAPEDDSQPKQAVAPKDRGGWAKPQTKEGEDAPPSTMQKRPPNPWQGKS